MSLKQSSGDSNETSSSTVSNLWSTVRNESWQNGGVWVNGGLGLWNDTSTGDSNGSWLRDSDGSWVADLVTVGDGDGGRLRTVSGVVSDGLTVSDGGVNVGGHGSGSESRGDSDSRELHC